MLQFTYNINDNRRLSGGIYETDESWAAYYRIKKKG